MLMLDKNAEGYEDKYGGYDYGVRNKGKSPCQLHFWSMEPLVDYCLVRISQGNFLKDVKFLPSEKSITQQKSLVCDFKVRKVKDTRRSVVPRRKICKLYKDNVNSDSRSYINNCSTNSKKDASVEGY